MAEGTRTLWGRYGHTVRQFFKFGVVGGSGVLVNMLVVILLRRMYPHYDDPLLGLPGTDFNIRIYHVYMTIAFIVANTWNYQLNRWWTFRSKHLGSWWKSYIPFLASGVTSLLVSLLVSTLMLNPTSPLALPPEVFDDSTGLRTRLYWANLTGTLIATPVNFVLSKLWVFRGVRARNVRARQEVDGATDAADTTRAADTTADRRAEPGA